MGQESEAIALMHAGQGSGKPMMRRCYEEPTMEQGFVGKRFLVKA